MSRFSAIRSRRLHRLQAAAAIARRSSSSLKDFPPLPRARALNLGGGQWNSGGQCHKETEPIYNETFIAKYPEKMIALEGILHKMETQVVYLNISRLTDYRKDGHPSIYRKKYNSTEEHIEAEKIQDCSHWCLPGVPDTWNELLYASLLREGRGSWKQ